MSVRNCSRCGKIFIYNGVNRICPHCRQKAEKDFEKVKEFLWDNPNSDISTVSRETGVEREQIVEFIRSNRLIAEDIRIKASIECLRCGAIINSGKYCEKCINEIKDDVKTGQNKEKKRKERKKRKSMHTRNRLDNK